MISIDLNLILKVFKDFGFIQENHEDKFIFTCLYEYNKQLRLVINNKKAVVSLDLLDDSKNVKQTIYRQALDDDSALTMLLVKKLECFNETVLSKQLNHSYLKAYKES